MPLFFSLLLFALLTSGHAQSLRSKHRLALTTGKHTPNDLFRGCKSLKERVNAYNSEMDNAMIEDFYSHIEYEKAERFSQKAHQARDAGGDDAEAVSDEKIGNDAVLASQKASLNARDYLAKANKMIRILTKDRQFVRNYHLGPEYHFVNPYYQLFSMKIREKIITSSIVANLK